jgi:hypothetical protein
MGTFPIVFLGLLAFLLVTLAFVLVNPQGPSHRHLAD